MKSSLFSFTLLIFYFQISAQVTFEKVIDTLGSASGYCIRPTFDGGFVFCGHSSFNGNDIQVTKLDSLGNVVWMKLYSGPGIEGATDLEQMPDSTYIVHGIYNSGSNAQSWLIGLDGSGDSLWSQLYSVGPGSTSANSRNSMAVMNNLTGITGCYNSQPPTHVNGFFFNIIGNGSVLASKVYDFSPYGTQPMAISSTINNEYLITGSIGTGGVTSDIFLMRTDVFGDTIWFKMYDLTNSECGYDVITTSDNGILIAAVVTNSAVSTGNICLIKTNSQGDTLWTKTFAHNYEQVPNSVKETPDGGFIITGNTVGGSPLNMNVYLLKTNNSGDSLWSREFGGTSADLGFSVYPLNDNGFILSGGTASFGNGGSYIIKTDSSGSITTEIHELVYDKYNCSVYPNPAKDKISIRVPSGRNDKYRLEIYNLDGRLYYDNILTGELNTFNTEDFPSSVYYCKITFNNFISNIQLVIVD